MQAPPPAEGAVIEMPVLPPRLSELLAVKVAPPEKVRPLTLAQLMVGVPVATEMVETALIVVTPKKIGAVGVPAKLKALVIVSVFEVLNVTLLGPTILSDPSVVGVSISN